MPDTPPPLLPLLAALTLGLAPFAPEPHLFGKLRWLAGGAHGMSPMDVFDLVLHGSPWVWLAGATVRWVAGRRTDPGSSPRDTG